MDTPVVFLIFNRPELTQQVFRVIKQVRPSRLLVVADGPRFPEEARQCRAARAIVDGVNWDCEVSTNFSDCNLGCKARVSSGLDWAFSLVEEAIVLEDDCLPHPDFFPFCREMLHAYRDDERIMMISGCNFLNGRKGISESYFFSRYFAVWGWASWRRAWRKYDIGMRQWELLKARRQLDAFYGQDYMRAHVTAMFDAARRNEIDTWDIQWFYTCLFNNGLSVVPAANLVSNIGVVGTHSTSRGRNQSLPTASLDIAALRHPDPRLLFPDHRYDDLFFALNFKPKTRGVAGAIARRILPAGARRLLKNLTRELMSGAAAYHTRKRSPDG